MSVPSGLASLSQTAASNSPAGSDTVFPSLDDYLREIFADLARLRDGAHYILGTISGTDTITAANAQFSSFSAGQVFSFISAGANTTTTVTLNINSIGAKPVLRPGGGAMAVGDIPASAFVLVGYDGTNMIHLDSKHATTADSVTNGVYTAGDQTIAGIKTFSSSPVVPDATTDTQAASKGQLDVATAAINAEIASRRRVAQIVTYATGAAATGTGTIPFDDTIPQNTEGDQYMSLAITPTSASSTLEIEVTVFASTTAAATNMCVALFQDSTANALAAGYTVTVSNTCLVCITYKHIMAAGTTSATTFKVRAGPDAAGTVTFNGLYGGRRYGGVMPSRITIKEYLP